MADNVPITAGVGTNISTDDVGGVHFQRVKLDKGADGVSDPIVAGSGLPVNLENSIPAGVNNIGDVDLASSIPAGVNNIGDVDIVSVPSTEQHLGMVSGQGLSVSTEITRPANLTPYAINDVINTTVASLLTFTDIARVNGGSGYIVKAHLVTNQSANVASYKLLLYSDNTPTPISDNSLFTLLWANRAIRVGPPINFSVITESAGSDCAQSWNSDIRIHFVTALASRNLYGVLITQSVFTPASGQKFFIGLDAEVD